MNIAVNAAALVVAPSVALSGDSDAEAIEAGKRFEKLFVTYMPAWLEWTKLARQAKQEAYAKFGSDYRSPAWSKPLSGQSPATLFHAEVCRHIGTDRASERMTRIYGEMDPLAEQIRNAEIRSVEGLRSKVLVAMWETQPLCARHSGELEFDHEGNFRSLLTGAVAVTGLSDFFASYVELVKADAADDPSDAFLVPQSGGVLDHHDPILAAIEAHKDAVAAYNAKIYAQDPLEAAIPAERRKSDSAEEIVETDDPRWISFQKDMDSLANAEIEAECGLASVSPTSIAGVIALLEYAAEVEQELGFREIYLDPEEPNLKRGQSWYYYVNRNLAGYLRTINGHA